LAASEILDHDFNLVHAKVIALHRVLALSVKHICEMPGGDIAMAATINQSDNINSWINAAFVLTGPTVP
jgi:hypothetical protein